MPPQGELPLRYFYKQPGENVLLWTAVFLGVVVVGGLVLHRFFLWLHARRERNAFFRRVVERGLDGGAEDALVDLVNRHLDILGRPSEIFRSLRIFDRAASREITLLLTSGRPPEEKGAELDRIYLLRERMFPARGLAPRRGEDETPAGETS